jgi:hypothetical protein
MKIEIVCIVDSATDEYFQGELLDTNNFKIENFLTFTVLLLNFSIASASPVYNIKMNFPYGAKKENTEEQHEQKMDQSNASTPLLPWSALRWHPPSLCT